MIKSRLGKASALFALAALLAGCIAAEPPPMRTAAPLSQPQRQAIDGEWVDRHGSIFIMRAGTFEIVAGDTGNRMSSGRYSTRDSRLFEFEGYSEASQRQVRADCLLASQASLNCTAIDGTQFSLVRRA